jgi:hypothetical protein
MPAEEIAVKGVVGVAEKRPRSSIAALRDVVRQSGNDDASQTSHGRQIDTAVVFRQ